MSSSKPSCASPDTSPRLPSWLKVSLPRGRAFADTAGVVAGQDLHTVCRQARCPNIFECFSSGVATFLILGGVCTRGCGFCNITAGAPAAPDPGEPERVAQAAARLNLRHVVVTSVTRDDLPDGGAALFAATIRAVRQALPQAGVEVLIPDFQGDQHALETVLDAAPDVLNHNLETVPQLYPTVRAGADYSRSLELLARARALNPDARTKSGLMLGLGETRDELLDTLADLLEAGCEMLTLGQYLQPSPAHMPVVRYVPPAEFDELGRLARRMGFAQVASGPFVRSSYHARDMAEASP